MEWLYQISPIFLTALGNVPLAIMVRFGTPDKAHTAPSLHLVLIRSSLSREIAIVVV